MRFVVRWNRPVSGFGACVVVNNCTGRVDAKLAALAQVIEPGATDVSVDPEPLDESAVFVACEEIDARPSGRGAA